MKLASITSFFATLLALVISINYAFAEEKPLPDVKSTQIEIMKKNPSEQICMDCAESNTSGQPRILSEAGRRGVSMQCFVTNNGHTVRITAQNTNNSLRRCSSNCYYKDSAGLDGVHRCSGPIAGNYNGLFCDSTTSNRTYTITDVGAFDCD